MRRATAATTAASFHNISALGTNCRCNACLNISARCVNFCRSPATIARLLWKFQEPSATSCDTRLHRSIDQRVRFPAIPSAPATTSSVATPATTSSPAASSSAATPALTSGPQRQLQQLPTTISAPAATTAAAHSYNICARRDNCGISRALRHDLRRATAATSAASFHNISALGTNCRCSHCHACLNISARCVYFYRSPATSTPAAVFSGALRHDLRRATAATSAASFHNISALGTNCRCSHCHACLNISARCVNFCRSPATIARPLWKSQEPSATSSVFWLHRPTCTLSSHPVCARNDIVSCHTCHEIKARCDIFSCLISHNIRATAATAAAAYHLFSSVNKSVYNLNSIPHKYSCVTDKAAAAIGSWNIAAQIAPPMASVNKHCLPNTL